jgi:hypothetical protein
MPDIQGGDDMGQTLSISDIVHNHAKLDRSPPAGRGQRARQSLVNVGLRPALQTCAREPSVFLAGLGIAMAKSGVGPLDFDERDLPNIDDHGPKRSRCTYLVPKVGSTAYVMQGLIRHPCPPRPARSRMPNHDKEPCLIAEPEGRRVVSAGDPRTWDRPPRCP